MSALATAVLDEAVRIVNAGFSPADPKISFLGLRARLITEANKRRAAYLQRKPGSIPAHICVQEWCNHFINLLDHPELLRQDQTIEKLCVILDALERGENRTAMEVIQK